MRFCVCIFCNLVPEAVTYQILCNLNEVNDTHVLLCVLYLILYMSTLIIFIFFNFPPCNFFYPSFIKLFCYFFLVFSLFQLRMTVSGEPSLCFVSLEAHSQTVRQSGGFSVSQSVNHKLSSLVCLSVFSQYVCMLWLLYLSQVVYCFFTIKVNSMLNDIICSFNTSFSISKLEIYHILYYDIQLLLTRTSNGTFHITASIIQHQLVPVQYRWFVKLIQVY